MELLILLSLPNVQVAPKRGGAAARCAAGEPLDALALIRGDGSVVDVAEATREYRSRPRRAKSS
jgi:hypothetical protein